MRASRRRDRRHPADWIIDPAPDTLLRIDGTRGVRGMNDTITRLREQWSDSLLTALTVLLCFMLFVMAPL